MITGDWHLYAAGYGGYEYGTTTFMLHSRCFTQQEFEWMLEECVVESAREDRALREEYSGRHRRDWNPWYSSLHDRAVELLCERHGFVQVDKAERQASWGVFGDCDMLDPKPERCSPQQQRAHEVIRAAFPEDAEAYDARGEE